MNKLSTAQVLTALLKGRKRSRESKVKSPFKGKPKLPDPFTAEEHRRMRSVLPEPDEGDAEVFALLEAISGENAF
jgi:hypothetical protein